MLIKTKQLYINPAQMYNYTQEKTIIPMTFIHNKSLLLPSGMLLFHKVDLYRRVYFTYF